MTGPDPRLLRSIQKADQERERRVRAERQASALRAQNTLLRQQLRRLTGDSAAIPAPAPTPGNSDRPVDRLR
jgi:hypothetical protein